MPHYSWSDVRKAAETKEPLNPVPTGMEVVPVVGLTFIERYPNNVLNYHTLGNYSEIKVELRRNPDNQYDNNAVEVYTNGLMLGHIPKEVAARIAPTMDSGIEYEAFVYGIRVSPDNPNNPGIDLVVGPRREN